MEHTSCVMSINDILIDEFGAELDVLKVRLTYLVKLISKFIFSSHSLPRLFEYLLKWGAKQSTS